MDINEERQTELLWRRIVDLRSRDANVPLDDRGPELESGELIELQRLAEATSEIMDAEVIIGRQAARDRLVQYTRANPVSPRSKSRPTLQRRGISQKALLVIAILLFAIAIAVGAANYFIPAYQGSCGTSGSDGDMSGKSANPAQSMPKRDLKPQKGVAPK